MNKEARKEKEKMKTAGALDPNKDVMTNSFKVSTKADSQSGER